MKTEESQWFLIIYLLFCSGVEDFKDSSSSRDFQMPKATASLQLGVSFKSFLLSNVFSYKTDDHFPFNSRRTVLVSIDRSKAISELDYSPGDHLAVFAPNPPDFVEAVLNWLPEAEQESSEEIMEFQKKECEF